MWREVRQFLEESTIHGVAHISTARHVLLKLIWAVVVATSFAFAIHMISSSYLEWSESPVSSLVTTRPISDLTFPEVTICPPKGTNTAVNHVLDKVKNKGLSTKQKDIFKSALQDIFISRPSKRFATDMAHLLNIGSLQDMKEGCVEIIYNDNSSILMIQTNISKGKFSTPGFGDPEYLGEFFALDHEIHLQLNTSAMFSSSSSSELVINVTASDDEEWHHTSQDAELKLYKMVKPFHEAENFCIGLGGHLASARSKEENGRVLSEARDSSVWLGGTDEATEGHWSWLDGNPWNFTNWGKYEPSSQNGDQKNCLTVRALEGELSPSWHAVSCEDTSGSFLCRVEPTKVTGSKTLNIQKDQNVESHKIVWSYNAKSRRKLKNANPGLKVSWLAVDSKQGEKEVTGKSVVPWDLKPQLQYFGLKKTWEQAEEFCVCQGGHLASVTSQSEHDHLKELLKDETEVEFVWLGGSDKAREGEWVWSSGAPWIHPSYVWPWSSGEPDGNQGENCLFLVWSGGSDYRWIDHRCDYNGSTGLVCQIPTAKSNFWELLQIVSNAKERGLDENSMWNSVLNLRGSQFSSTACLNTSEVAGVIERLKSEINFTSKTIGSELTISEEELVQAVEIFSILHFCSPPHLVEAVSLGQFFLKLLSEESMGTFVTALLRTIHDLPENELLAVFYEQLDNHYNFSLGPLIMALSNTQQLGQLLKQQPAYIRNYVDVIQQCLHQQNCAIETGPKYFF